MAAVLAAGTDAVLSHRSAAALWGLRRADSDRIAITSPRSTRSSHLLQRHCATLPKDEVTLRNRIPVTTVGRTLFDLAAPLTAKELERALREAEVLRLPLRPSFTELLARHPGQRGARTLRSVLDRLSQLPGGVAATSRIVFCDSRLRLGFPPPETNVKIRAGTRPYEADCLWRAQRLILALRRAESA